MTVNWCDQCATACVIMRSAHVPDPWSGFGSSYQSSDRSISIESDPTARRPRPIPQELLAGVPRKNGPPTTWVRTLRAYVGWQPEERRPSAAKRRVPPSGTPRAQVALPPPAAWPPLAHSSGFAHQQQLLRGFLCCSPWLAHQQQQLRGQCRCVWGVRHAPLQFSGVRLKQLRSRGEKKGSRGETTGSRVDESHRVICGQPGTAFHGL